MKKLGIKGTRLLKTLHLLCAGLWLGAAASLVLLNFMSEARAPADLHGHDAAMRFIDDYIIIPGAMGALFTGLAYSIWTNWGFFTHRWVTVKWVITLYGVLFGTFFLGPWLNGMEDISRLAGAAASKDPVYLHNLVMNRWWGLVQVASLACAMVVSTLKPWGKAKTGKNK